MATSELPDVIHISGEPHDGWWGKSYGDDTQYTRTSTIRDTVDRVLVAIRSAHEELTGHNNPTLDLLEQAEDDLTRLREGE